MTAGEQAHRLGVALPCTISAADADRSQKPELGPYAFEPCMPDRLHKVLAQDGQTNVIRVAISRLLQLLEDDPRVIAARLCSKDVPLVHKLAREGETFCGYRNIQMLLQSMSSAARWKSIFDIQDMIEQAWDQGYNAHARTATGGVRNTRKYIGTSEVEALLQSLELGCTGSVLSGEHAARDLCASIAGYYGVIDASGRQMTDLPPVFLQLPRHSVLVVGAARLKTGLALLVFDPAIPPGLSLRRQWKSAALRRLFGKTGLASHLRTEAALARFAAFEMLTIEKPSMSDVIER